MIRRVAAPLAARGPWYLTETRAFFACRAATWDTKFGDDLPAYCAAVAEAGIRRGGVVIDVGCGTGRALPPLREAVGPAGAVIALDVTPEMLARGPPGGRSSRAPRWSSPTPARCRFADGSADAIFAAGLVNHLPDTEAGLRELARVTSPGGLLVLFHPSGRAALAARHGHALSPDEPLAEGPLRRSTAAAGWALTAYDDAPHRFFARRGTPLPLKPAGAATAGGTRRARSCRGSPGRRPRSRGARRGGSRRSPALRARRDSIASTIGSSTARCACSRPAGSSPARSRRASLSSSSERISRTCSTGACSQRPAASRPSSVARVDGALRAEAGLGALGDDEPRVEQAADRAVDDRLRDLPDPAEVAAGRGQLRDREAVRRLLAEDREHQPFRQRHLGKRWRS